MSNRTTRARKNLLTLADAAAELGIADRTIRRYIAAGHLQVIRVNARVVRIDPAELDRFINARTVA